MRYVVASLVLLAGLTTDQTTARAQASSADSAAADSSAAAASRAEASRAETAFAQGLEQAGYGAWAASERSFRRAYVLSANPAALYNRALALRELGRIEDARASLRRVLFSEDVPEALRGASREALAGLRSSTATLRLVGLSPVPHRVVVDGEPVPDRGARPMVVRAHHGAHTVAVELDGHVARWWSGTLAEGESRDLHIDLRPNPPAGRRPGLEAEPLFWILVSAGSALIGAAIALPYAIAISARAPSPTTVRF